MVNFEEEENAESKFLVEHLSDAFASCKTITGVAQRIHDRREAFFNQQRQQLFHILATIARESETTIQNIIHNLHISLAEHDHILETLLNDCDPRSAETDISLQTFQHSAREFIRSFTERRAAISGAQNTVETTEQTRKTRITEVFEEFLPRMMENSHVLGEEVSRIMEQELLTINQIILRNRRAYTALFERVSLDVVMKEKQCHERMKLNQSEWKEEKLGLAMLEARRKLEEECNVRSEDVEAIADGVRERLGACLWTGSVIVGELEEMVSPPRVTLDRCRDWLKRAEEATKDLYDVSLEGIEEVRQFGEAVHLRFFNDIGKMAQTLQHDLDYPSDEMQWKFQNSCLHLSAGKQSQLESDLQTYTYHLLQQREEEVALLHRVFAFLHGAVWHWQLHLTSVAKAEDFLDLQLHKQQTLIQQQMEAKAGKIRTVLENLRFSSSQTVTNTQLHAAANITADLEHQLAEMWKKTVKIFAAYPTLINVLSRGYQERIFAYFQVSLANPTSSPLATLWENSTNSSVSHHSALPAPQISSNNLSHTATLLPDIDMNEEERSILQELSLSPADTENLSVRMQSIPAFEEDPRLPPSSSIIHTKKGVPLYPGLTSLQTCFRFAVVKAEDDVGDVCETQSQIDMTKHSTMFHPPERFGLVDLSGIINALPDVERVKTDAEEVQKRIRVAFLSHAVDEWRQIVDESSQSLMETKKEAFQLELQTRMRCLQQWTSGLVEVVARKRAKELIEHEEEYKEVERRILTGISNIKLVDIAGISKAINERLLVARNCLTLLEKGMVNATRQGYIDNIKQRMKEEVNRYMTFVKKLVTEFRATIHPKCQQMQQQVRDAIAAMKKSADGGSYTPEDIRQYEHLLTKFLDKLKATEKASLEETRLIEVKHRTIINAFLSKLSEKIPAHETDVEAIRTLTSLLAHIQSAIKKHAVLFNVSLAEYRAEGSRIKASISILQNDHITAQIAAEELLRDLVGMLRALRESCAQLGCLIPGWTVASLSSSTSSPSSNASTHDIQLSSPSATASTQLRTATTMPSSMQKSGKGLGRSSIQLSGQRRVVGRNEVTAKDLPTDFQLMTLDGPVPLVQPRNLSSLEGKGIVTHAAPSSEMNPGAVARGSINAVQKRKQRKLERYQVFGEVAFADAKTFLEKVHVICWKGMNEGLAFAEEYHHLRGSRTVTRPALMPDTFETTAEKMCKKLLNYLTQSEQFARLMVDKFRDVSDVLRETTVELAPLLLRYFLQVYRQELVLKLRLMRDEFGEQRKRICENKEEVDDLIQNAILLRENDTKGIMGEISRKTSEKWLETLRLLTTDFLRRFNNASEKLFAACDLFLTPDEMRTPITPPTVTTRSQSRRFSTVILSPIEHVPSRSSPGQIWRMLLLDGIDGVSQEDVNGKDVSCSRTIMAHLTVEEARHRVYADFRSLYQENKSLVAVFDIEPEKEQDEMGHVEFVQRQLKRLQIVDKLK